MAIANIALSRTIFELFDV